MKHVLVILFFFSSILVGQNIIVSKDSLKYLTSLQNNTDSIYIYNAGKNILSIDSMENFNYTYSYLLKFSYKDSIERSGYVGYYSEIFPSTDLFPMEILPNDSAKFVFQYIPPVTKTSTMDEIRKDSLFIYNNSQNRSIVIINVVNDIPLGIDDRTNEPFSYILLQNYPNPFNPITTINYSISRRCFVTLKIYDVLGREITTVVSEEKATGVYKISFNASKYASGVYFYQLKTNDIVLTKKMILSQ